MCLSVCLSVSTPYKWNSFSRNDQQIVFTYICFFSLLDELYDEVSAVLNETYQKLIAPPEEETPSVSLKDFVRVAICLSGRLYAGDATVVSDVKAVSRRL